MNRYPLTLRDRLRFRFGLRWAASLPSMADIKRFAKGLLYAAALLIAYANVSNREYAEAMAAEAQAQARDNRALTAALATCVSTWADADEPQARFVPTTQEDI